MESKLVNYQDKLNDLHNTLNETVNSSIIPDEVKQSLSVIDNIYKSKLDNLQPRIMVFGIYNAGKSSIINELIREDKAKVQDVPTTDRIDIYKWNGYDIADTPGVGAPIEHEKVTAEALKAADVVLFVMSTTGSNEKAENYVRMKDIADAGKKIIIVLNDKNGDLGNNDPDIQKIKFKVYENMKKVGIQDVDSRYCIVVVNAKRARTGRLKNKLILWEKSNFQELEKVILQELKKANSFFVMNNAIREILVNIDTIINEINIYPQGEDGADIKRLIEDIQGKKSYIDTEMDMYVKRRASMLNKELPALIWKQRNESEIETKDIMNNKINEFIQMIQKRHQDLIQMMLDETHDDIDILSSKYKKGISSIENGINICQILSTMKKECKPMSVDVTHASNKSSTAGEAMQNIILGKTAEMAIKNLPKFLPLPIPVPPPVIIPIIIKCLKALFSDDQEEKEARIERRNQQELLRVEAENQARQELQQKIGLYIEELCEECLWETKKITRNIIKDITKVYTQQLQAVQSDKNKHIQVVDTLKDIKSEYENISDKLSNNSFDRA